MEDRRSSPAIDSSQSFNSSFLGTTFPSSPSSSPPITASQSSTAFSTIMKGEFLIVLYVAEMNAYIINSSVHRW